MGDSKSGLGLLLGFGKPKSGGDDEDGLGDARRMAAKAMFKALKNDDFDDFYEAFCEALDADADSDMGDDK